MKIAVISDIHANLTALKRVLDDIKKQNCDKIFCLGDLAMAGPEPNKTVAFIRSQQDWTVIQGNTDKMIAECSKELIENTKKAFPVMGKSLEDDDKIITDENREYLKNLPPKASKYFLYTARRAETTKISFPQCRLKRLKKLLPEQMRI